jgi:hypothetical protein
MGRRRKFKAIQWLQMSGSGGHLPFAWYVVEVNDCDGSYFPLKGPVSKGYAKQEADRLQKAWDEAKAASAAHLKEA